MLMIWSIHAANDCKITGEGIITAAEEFISLCCKNSAENYKLAWNLKLIIPNLFCFYFMQDYSWIHMSIAITPKLKITALLQVTSRSYVFSSAARHRVIARYASVVNVS